MNRDLLAVGAALAALLLFMRRSSASVAPFNPGLQITFPDYPAPAPAEETPPVDLAPRAATIDDPEANMIAFLQMIRFAEHDADTVRAGADFGTFYGNSRFTNFRDHPVVTGEKSGVRLSADQCSRAGLPFGCVSTAAGAFQFTLPTWQEMRAKAPRLPDFSPASQMEAARRLLDQIGAGPLIRTGAIAPAVAIAARRWDSLPGSGNPRSRSADYIAARFAEAGGVTINV